MQIESPFPVEGTVTPTDYGHSTNLPCESEWLTEAPNGDYLQQAVDRAAREYGEGTTVRVRWTGRHGECNGFELLGTEGEE
ncbi:hypothetical protein ACFQO4_20830 [Saliphagus sp. GCM10025334]